MTSRHLRLLRGTASSSIATLIAAVSHTVGGGAPPHLLLMLTVSVLLTPVAALLVGTRIRLPGLAAAVISTQVAFHTLFAAAGEIAPSAVGGGHQHGPLVLAFPPQGATASAMDAPMAAAHLVAAVLTILLLRRGELLVQTVVRWVRMLLRRPLNAPRLPVATPPGAPRSTPRAARRLLADCAWRRGPPLAALG